MDYAVSCDGEVFYGRLGRERAESLTPVEAAMECGRGLDEVGDAYWVGERVDFEPTVDVEAVLESVSCQADDCGEAGGTWVNEQLYPAFEEDERGERRLRRALQAAFDGWLEEAGVKPSCFYAEHLRKVAFDGEGAAPPSAVKEGS